MNHVSPSGTQLSFLSDTRSGRPTVANARMATHVLERLLKKSPSVSSQSAVFFKAIFPTAVSAAESSQGLPVTKTTLRPQLMDPSAAIMVRPPTRPDEFGQMETLIEFVQRRMGSSEGKLSILADIEKLLGPDSPELLITQDGIPSPLFLSDRTEAGKIFSPLLSGYAAETAEALIEAYVLLRSNNADVQSGIAKLFWRQNTGSASAEHYIEGCADGQARSYFRLLLGQSETRQRQLFSLIDLETFYATLGSSEARIDADGV